MVVEIDFPRGGEPERIGPKKRRHIIFGEKGKKSSGDASKSTNIENAPAKETDEYESVFRQNLTLELLSPGVRGLGIVKQINDIDVTLECADGILLKLPGNCISRTFTDSLQTTEKTLEDIFVTGQAIAFKVTKAFTLRDNHKKSKPEVTTCPYAVNSHLLSSNLLAGLVLNGIVMSVEEKGAVLDFGLPSKITGFVNVNELPPYLTADQLCVGQVLLVRVKTTPTSASRVVAVSAVPEMMAFDHDRLSLNQLMPGTVLLAQLEKVTRSGVFVAFSNDVKGFVRNLYLPPRFRIDPSQVTNAKALKLCVLACQQNSPLLILTGNTDVVAMSKVEKRALPEQFKVGQKVNCKVYELDKNKNVFFTLEEDENGKLPTIVAKAWRNQIDEPEKNLPKFTVGSEHVCRVIGYHAMERLILVSTKAEVLKQKIVSVDEAKAGDKYTATVIAIKPNGLRVQLCNDIQGHIPAMHVKNKLTKNWEKGFRNGQSINCQVLFKDTAKNNLILTAKPMMVESEERIISEMSESLVGEVAVGSVIKVMDSGSLLVGFYNRVVGLLEAFNAAKIANVYMGMPLKVRVKKVSVEENHMLLDFGEDSLDNIISAPIKKSAAVEAKPKEKKKVLKPAKPFLIYTAKVVGGWPYGGTSAVTSAELLLNGGTIGRLHASELDLSNYAKGSKPMEEFLDRNKGKTVNVKVICVGNPKSISKEGKNILMKQIETSRFVECTLNPEKIMEVRRKLNLINFKTDFRYGELVPVFFTLDFSRNATINGEINPLFKAIIVQSETEGLECGSLISGKVVGVNKTTRSKCVLIGDDAEKTEDGETAPKRRRTDSTM